MYRLRFTIFSHEEDEEMVMDFKRINSNEVETMKMKRSEKQESWLESKYGMNVIPWECYYDMPNLDNDASGGFRDLNDTKF